MGKIKVAIAGVGNCASSLLQGIEYYRNNGSKDTIGLMHWDFGGYLPTDIEVVTAFDIDKRKVGQPLNKALFSSPNCTKTIWEDIPDKGVVVQMGPVLDGVSGHMSSYDPDKSFVVIDEPPVDVVKVLKESRAEILLCYLPVGSEEAVQFYADCCLKTGISLINCVPVFIASNPTWEKEFKKRGIPIVGDDIKSQLGATIVHRNLTKLFADRGIKLDRTYQLNTGGNTDFLNMLNRERLQSKKISKTEAVQSQLEIPLEEDNIHIGPSDYVPWQKDNKVCFLRMEGRGFAGVPLTLELRLSVEDSPNSAGVAIDVIRYCRLARDRGEGGALLPISAYCMKHPPQQMNETEARALIEEFIRQSQLTSATARIW